MSGVRGRSGKKREFKQLTPLDPDKPERPVGRPRQFEKDELIFVTVRMPKTLEKAMRMFMSEQTAQRGRKVFRSDVLREALEKLLGEPS